MKNCESCQTPNPDDASHCGCGHEFAPETIGDHYFAALQPRPTSVSVISWLTIIGGVLFLLRLPSALSGPVAMEFQGLLIADIAVVLLRVVSAFGMLAGYPWARSLFAIAGSVGLIIAFIMAPAAGALFSAFFVIFLMFLYSANANAYFAQRKHSL